MKTSVTVIITIRDREAWRVQQQVESIRSNGADPKFIVIDYGSKKTYAEAYATVASRLGLEYLHVFTEGLPWNKCHALNIGARIAQSPFVVTSDVDMFYSSDPFSYCLSNENDKNVFHIDTYWLDRKKNFSKAKFAGHGNPGGFQFLPRSAFERAGGYDERIVYWGLEDLDWPERLKALGYEQEWLPAEHKIYHQWHASSESGGIRPVTASFNTMTFCVENRINPVLSQEWGSMISKNERPILELHENGTLPSIVIIPKNALMLYSKQNLLLDSKMAKGYTRLELGERLVRRPLSKFRKHAKKWMQPLSAMTGNTVIDKTNCNIDYLYAMLPMLKKHGLLDYYIADDFSFIDLLWE